MQLQIGKHFVVAQITSMGAPAVLTFEEHEGARAKHTFFGYVQDSACNWVKFYTIRRDGAYVFNGDFQQRISG